MYIHLHIQDRSSFQQQCLHYGIFKSFFHETNITKIWRYIENNQVNNDIIKHYIIKTIEYTNIDLNNNKYFYNFVNTMSNIDELLEREYKQVNKNLCNYKFDFKQSIILI